LRGSLRLYAPRQALPVGALAHGRRVGISRARSRALRYWLRGSPWISRGKV
jgi:3-methyladenine DNA glycosylase Mpg